MDSKARKILNEATAIEVGGETIILTTPEEMVSMVKAGVAHIMQGLMTGSLGEPQAVPAPSGEAFMRLTEEMYAEIKKPVAIVEGFDVERAIRRMKCRKEGQPYAKEDLVPGDEGYAADFAARVKDKLNQE